MCFYIVPTLCAPWNKVWPIIAFMWPAGYLSLCATFNTLRIVCAISRFFIVSSCQTTPCVFTLNNSPGIRTLNRVPRQIRELVDHRRFARDNPQTHTQTQTNLPHTQIYHLSLRCFNDVQRVALNFISTNRSFILIDKCTPPPSLASHIDQWCINRHKKGETSKR